jgi:hypothetical protein
MAWRPYRWRGYAVGVVAGFLVGGVVAPIATASVVIALAAAGTPIQTAFPVWEMVCSLVFAATMSVAGATAFARWQPQPLRRAAQTYLWLATRAEAHWTRTFAAQPVPRDEARTRAFLASVQPTAATAFQRFGLWLAVLELGRAREAIAQMPESTALDSFNRASAAWLVDFVSGITNPLAPLEAMTRQIDDPAGRLEASVTVAMNRARAALAEGQDWRPPLADARVLLDADADRIYDRLVRRPVLRALLVTTAVGVALFWVADLVLLG